MQQERTIWQQLLTPFIQLRHSLCRFTLQAKIILIFQAYSLSLSWSVLQRWTGLPNRSLSLLRRVLDKPCLLSIDECQPAELQSWIRGV